MKLRNEVQWIKAGQEPGFLIDTRVGGIHGLNQTAAVLVEALHEGSNVEALETLLLARFEVGKLAAQQDVHAFTQLLMENDLVEY